MTMTAIQIKDAWKGAKSLRLSLGHGHEAEEEFMYMALGVAAESPEDGRFVANFFLNDPDLKEFVLNAIALAESSDHFGSLIGRDDALDVMRMFLEPFVLGLLQCEVLQGYGYVLPRNITDTPMPIPEDVWFGKIDWRGSSVIGGGLSFASVRIAPAAETGETDLFKVITSHLPTQGRPTKKNLILDAFKFGVENKLLDFSGKNSATYHTVREIIQTRWPDEYENGKGLQDGAMQKHLASLIETKRMS